MEKKTKKKLHLGFWILTLLLALLWFFYLEINKIPSPAGSRAWWSFWFT